MSTGCEGMQESIEAYAAGRADAAQSARLEAHLASCEACRRELRWVRALRAGVRSAPAPAMPAELRADLMRLAREAARSRREADIPWYAALWSWRAAAGLGLATACAAALLVFGRPGAGRDELTLDEVLVAHGRYELTMPAADREAIYADLGARLAEEGGSHD